MDLLFVPLLHTVAYVLSTYRFFLFIYVILDMLQQFEVVNRYNRVVYFITNILFRLYEPVLGRLRAFIPNLGGIDLSPLALIVILFFLQQVLHSLLEKFPS